MKILCIGDAMIPGIEFATAAQRLGTSEMVAADWETDWERLQHRRLVVEQEGPGIEDIPAVFLEHRDAEIVLGLFCPLSAESMNAFRNLKIIGTARAGTENVDIQAATERGIAVVHVMGRNAEAVSDYTIGLLLSETRNIARAHAAIQNGHWRKKFANSDYVPELKRKTVGIVGFGHIGRLVAKKLSGFDVRIVVYDPLVNEKSVQGFNVSLVDQEMLFREADFITLHARLTKDNHGFVGRSQLGLMKPTAYLLNTARSGLIDMDALVDALKEKRIAGAGLDVFEIEPIPPSHPILQLDNVTLTTHIAGTTREALTRSPELLVEEVCKLLTNEPGVTLKNPEVLNQPGFRDWLSSKMPTARGRSS